MDRLVLFVLSLVVLFLVGLAISPSTTGIAIMFGLAIVTPLILVDWQER